MAGRGVRGGSIGVGSVVSTFRLGEPLGAGGMGVVYAAELAGGESVAVKLLRREWLSDDFMIRSFRAEGLAGHLVRHPNVVAVIERGETAEGVPFLIMERVPGEPLGMRVERDGPLPPRRAASIVSQILAGLDAVHRAGIVHGDVKSDNVLVETRAEGADAAKLIDFGLARVPFARRAASGDRDLVAGTPDYMAPEVIRGRGSSEASDLYSVGVILYELITGATPFGGGSPDQILKRHLEEAVRPPSSRIAGMAIPDDFEQIVLRALAKDERRRFPSALLFGLALAQVMPLLDTLPAPAPDGIGPHEDAPTLHWRGRDRATHRVAERRRFPLGTPVHELRTRAR